MCRMLSETDLLSRPREYNLFLQNLHLCDRRNRNSKENILIKSIRRIFYQKLKCSPTKITVSTKDKVRWMLESKEKPWWSSQKSLKTICQIKLKSCWTIVELKNQKTKEGFKEKFPDLLIWTTLFILKHLWLLEPLKGIQDQKGSVIEGYKDLIVENCKDQIEVSTWEVKFLKILFLHIRQDDWDPLTLMSRSRDN